MKLRFHEKYSSTNGNAERKHVIHVIVRHRNRQIINKRKIRAEKSCMDLKIWRKYESTRKKKKVEYLKEIWHGENKYMSRFLKLFKYVTGEINETKSDIQ